MVLTVINMLKSKSVACWSTNMKREIITFRIEPMKNRHHKALFDEDLPFKHRVEKPKKGQYQRRDKHRNKDFWD